jgi:hypothetical protein
MELGALTTVLYASQQGKPVSTTHCITGATVGVGLCGGDLRCVNWIMVPPSPWKRRPYTSGVPHTVRGTAGAVGPGVGTGSERVKTLPQRGVA